METLLILRDEDISEDELQGFRTRRAVRGVISDHDNNVALLHVPAKGYYTLPGGGVGTDEDFRDAIVRECKEEIGCDIGDTVELGSIFEYRKDYKSINESRGYYARIIGNKGVPIFHGDEDEDEKSSVIKWMPVSEAIATMESIVRQDNLYDQYCIARDLAFIKKAKEMIVGSGNLV